MFKDFKLLLDKFVKKKELSKKISVDKKKSANFDEIQRAEMEMLKK